MDKKPITDPTAQTAVGFQRVDIGTTNPAAAKYAHAIQQRKAPAIPLYTEPVGGGPTPSIPRLDGLFQEGATMAQQAQSIIQQQAPQQQPQIPGGLPPGINPTDILPPEARNDPEFIEGQGAMFAAAQPKLAYKYGVLRQGQRIAPQQLQANRRRPIEETLKDMKAVDELMRIKEKSESGEAILEREAAAGPAGAAARVANLPGDESVNPVSAEEKAKLERAKKTIEGMDELDFSEFRSAMMKDLLNNDEQRKIIEARLKPLSLDDLITRGFVTQTVPIVPGVFEPTLRSMSAEEDLALKRLVMEESKSIAEVSDRYLLDKYSMMSVVVALYSIGKVPLPTHLDEKGDFSEELFWDKFNKVIKMPFHMLASLGVNFFWFDVRVRKLFVAEKIKNG